MHMTRPGRALFLLALFSGAGGLACGIGIRRDLSAIQPGQIGFDDMCGLQDYFDGLEAGVSRPPAVVSAVDLEGAEGQTTVRGGKARLAFEGLFLLKHGKRVLNENWLRLPEQLGKAERFDIEVLWAEKAGVRRVVTTQPAELIIGNDSYLLPYHACLSELLYGAPLYKQRREIWGLPAPTPAVSFTAHPEAGAVDQDGGTAADGGSAPAER
jgi:hypothetical protein